MSGQNQYDQSVTAHPYPTLALEDECYFEAPVRFGRRKADQVGHLSLTRRWLRFKGALDLSVAWSEVSSVHRVGADIVMTMHASDKAMRFSCQSVEEAERAAPVAERLARAAHEGSALHAFHAAV